MRIYQPFKKLSNRTTFFLASASFAILCTAATFIEKTNFSGEWKLNEQKSELGEYGYSVPKKLQVEEKENTLFIHRVISAYDKERTNLEKLSLDGKQNENLGFDALLGNFMKTSTVKWEDDGKSLIINSVIQCGKAEKPLALKATETWKLSNNGQSMQLETTSASRSLTYSSKAVYDKAR